MRYVIFVLLIAISLTLGHINNAELLINAENDAGNMGEYIGAAFIGPLILPIIIYGIAMIFLRKRKVNFFRCSNWILGVCLLGGIATFGTSSTPRHVTFPAAQLTVTVPDRTWKLTEFKGTKILLSGNSRVLINATRHSQEELGIHKLTDIEKYSREILGNEYDENIHQVYQCETKNFQCAFQDITIAPEGMEKEAIYIYLLDKTSVIQLTAIISKDEVKKDFNTVKDILNSAVNAEK